MPYDPNRHHRHTTRLQDYDYAQEGAYFVTICVHQRECLFGDIAEGAMRLNAYGDMVREEWLQTPAMRPYVELDEFVIMPNHLHGILIITERVGTWQRHVPTNQPREFGKPIAGSLSTIIGAFKAAVTKRVNHHRDTPGAPVWQARFHDIIIRNETMLNNMRQYIQTNPARWTEDEENPSHPW